MDDRVNKVKEQAVKDIVHDKTTLESISHRNLMIKCEQYMDKVIALIRGV